MSAKKTAAMAATPAHRPSMWSRMLNDAVMPTTQRMVRAASSHWPARPPSKTPKTCAWMPVVRRITAAKGMAAKSLTWWCSQPRSSRKPTIATSVAPVTMPKLCARAAPSKAISMASITPPYIASPPSKGMGLRCTLRGPGRSTMPTRIASARTGTVSTSDADKAIRNASRPALIHPRHSFWRN